MKTVLFDRRAEEEFSLGAQYYDEQEKGLGLRFLLAVEEATNKSASNPQIYPEIANGCRKCRVKKFPYALIFRVLNEGIQVIAVMHLKREPGYWKNRI
jgi:toxin ParE1/3/4